jgi:hypothetical protein
VCIELGQKLAKEQLEADAREKLLLQILPAGVIKKLLSNDYQNDETNNLDKGKGGGDRKQEKSTQKSKEKNSKQRIKEMIDLDMSSSSDNIQEDTFISFRDISAVAELKGKAIGNCLASIEPIITPEYVMYRIPTKEIEKALRNAT